MRYKFVCLFGILFLSSLSFSLRAQTDSNFFNRTINALERLPANEKVYLHLAKPGYFPGDTVWYKAYTVIGSNHKLSALSGVLYVELISPDDSLTSRQILHITSGVAWGEIALPGKLKPGSYRLRAYTKWMRNWGPEYFFDQKVEIFGAPEAEPINNGQPEPDVQFFPEGGDLVNGLRSRVAVKVINANGAGENVTGTVIDNERNEISTFESQHLGMGVFAFTPQKGKTYSAKIVTANKASVTVALPVAKEEGFTLLINNRVKDSIRVIVSANPQLYLFKQNTRFYLVAQSAGKIYYTATANLESPVFSTSIIKSRFPSGILQFTLFSDTGQPLNERVVFIQNNDTLKLNLTGRQGNYQTKEKVKINIDAGDAGQKPVTGTFSAAVINDSLLGVDEYAENTIFTALLLTSDIKGYIEKPNYYFLDPTDETRADLDVLMLTQGYRRFNWKEILNKTNFSNRYPPEKTLELDGSLQTPGDAPVVGGHVTLSATRENLYADTTTDINGNFIFKGLDLPDTAKIVLYARKKHNGSNLKIIVNNIDYPLPGGQGQEPSANVSLLRNSETFKKNIAALQERKKNDSLQIVRELKEVTIKGRKIIAAPDLSSSANLHGGGNADQVIMGDKISGCITVSDCLYGKIFGVNFGPDGTPSSTRGGKMSVIINGNILDGSNLNTINADDIYSIEVLRTSYSKVIYGSSIAPGGALVITLKNGSEGGGAGHSSPGLMTFLFPGFYQAREFYSPKYKNSKTDMGPSDVRNPVYWNPDIITDKDGKASFEYNNAGTKGTYRIVIEGLDDNGNLGRKVLRYKVE